MEAVSLPVSWRTGCWGLEAFFLPSSLPSVRPSVLPSVLPSQTAKPLPSFAVETLGTQGALPAASGRNTVLPPSPNNFHLVCVLQNFSSLLNTTFKIIQKIWILIKYRNLEKQRSPGNVMSPRCRNVKYTCVAVCALTFLLN